jgi:DNA-binding response OmpR family regulator/curved DNA-binding protein CbpA
VEIRGQDKNVLVVVDDAHTRGTIRTTLERAGFELDFIDDAEEALAACRARRPDALIVGSRLSKMDGFVFLYRLKGDGLAQLIPTLFVAEQRDAGRAPMAKSRGARAVLTKPLEVRGLLEHIHELTKGDGRRLDEEHRKQVAKLAEQEAARASSAPASQQPANRAPVKLAKKMVRRKRSPAGGSGRSALLQKLRDEVQRLKGLPYHQRLGLDLNPASEAVDAAFRKLAMPYHPDRYKQHGKEARRLAQGVFMLLREAKKSLNPESVRSEETRSDSKRKRSEATEARSSQTAATERESYPEIVDEWTPAEIDVEDIPSAPTSSSVGADSDADRESGERLTTQAGATEVAAEQPSPAQTRARAAALAALSERRFRDAKNQIGYLIDQLPEGETDPELELNHKLAMGHLRWEEGLHDEAVELFEQALALDADCEDALQALANLDEEGDKPSGGLLDRFLRRG